MGSKLNYFKIKTQGFFFPAFLLLGCNGLQPAIQSEPDLVNRESISIEDNGSSRQIPGDSNGQSGSEADEESVDFNSGDNIVNNPDPVNPPAQEENLGSTSGFSCLTMNDAECQALQGINKERIDVGLQPLESGGNCISAAQFHASDMLEFSYFAHNGRNETWNERMVRFNVRGARAENIAISPDPVFLVNQWLNSPPHRDNMLSSQFQFGGIGKAGDYWVLCLSSS